MEEFIKVLMNVNPNIDYANEKKMVDDGIIDSIDVVSIISELSDAFDVVIPSEEITPDNFNSVEAMKALIDRLKEE
jgi:Phosphopantetheine attachment site.